MNCGNFGFGNLPRIDAAKTGASFVNIEHDPGCFSRRFAEYHFQYMDDKIHGGIIIVQKNDPVERRLFGLLPLFFSNISFRFYFLIQQ